VRFRCAIRIAKLQRMSWYLRSLGDHDTHCGELREDGTVLARCGTSFTPRPTLKVVRPLPVTLVIGGLALRGRPPDPDQVWPQYQGDGGGR
jgi:hypothetical protein